MVDARTARRCFAVIAAVAWAGLALQLVLSITNDEGLFGSPQGRVVNLLSYFTVLSNLAVAVTHTMLARDLHRGSRTFWVFRLVAVLCITVTGVVFHLALASLQELTGWDLLADSILHTTIPALAALAWLLLGPRGRVDAGIVRLSIVPPAIWLLYTLVRGSFVQDVNGKDYYPYPFLDVGEHGYVVVLANAALVIAFFLALAAGALAADRRLRGVREDTST